MHLPNRDRWVTLWRATGAGGDAAGWYERLTSAYAEPHRYYHTQHHIAECLAEFDRVRRLARHPTAVELALWFHDAVYDPRAADNEEQSAALAKSCFAAFKVADALPETVAKLIMATKTHELNAGDDAELVIDIDLSVLGRDEEGFLQYEQQIRREYAWVPDLVFASKRLEILQRFVAREHLFATKWFRNKYEAQARRNLKASNTKLKRLCS